MTLDTVTLSLGAIIGLAGILLLFWRWRKNWLVQAGPSPTTLKVQFMDVDGWTIRYHRSGRGPNLVLLHGLGANLLCWRSLVPLLNSNFNVLALDLPGFGQSSKPSEARYGLDQQVERLAQILARLKIDETYIVGNSMGGNIALWYALEHPKQTLGVSLIAPAASPSLVPLPTKPLLWLARPASWLTNRRAMQWAHQRTVSKKHLVDQERVEETFKTYSRNPQAIRSFLLATEAIRDPRLVQRLKEVKCPVQLLWGSRDLLVPQSVIDRLERDLQFHESHVHEGGGHHLQEDEPAWVAEKIDAFIASLSHH